MSISSSDRAVMPENDSIEAVDTLVVDETLEAFEADVADVTADQTDDVETDAEPTITFGDLGLPEGVVRKLAQNGVTTPFPIQAATIPDALAGKDILGRGRTGSGKTLSFGLPLLATLAGGHTEKKKPRGVILTPTRELAMQVADALQPYGDVLGLKMKVVCGGTSMGNQIYALERGVDILVATPGRLRDIINRGACSLEQVQVAVLDEADQMADLGFLPEVTELLDQVPAGGQRLLFSATLENEIDSLVKRYLVNPVTHEVDPSAGAVTTMTHHVLVVKPKDKAPVTSAIAARKGRTIIFVRTQLGADRVAEQLRESGVKADALHGGMTQGARTRTLADFKEGYVNVLVATDVAARGIHVDGIDLVLNVDPAGDHKDYLHRSGRTARAGRSGVVVSLALPHQRRQIFRLMEDAGVEASRHIVGGAGAFDPEVAEITGARSLTEVQADSANNAAKQAEREVADLTKQLERVQRRAVELREEAERLVARAARERGEDPETAVAEAAEAAEAEVAAEIAAAAVVVEERPAYERRDERGNFERRDRRGERGFERRDDRGDRGGFRRDDNRGGGFNRDRGDRGFERRDDNRGGGFNRDRGDRGFERRDDNRGGGFNRDRGFERRDDRGDRGGFRRDDNRGGGFNRDRGDR
ncbi:DEAD/DEAH box helicase, partial [Streptomyces sp. NPDC090022]|uniref:DEAD/DEAH box helicase n=1 Tax=Streptomyces sp. NPDC090022 TaxID=3365920 RepID=UPI003818FB72